MTVGDKSAQSYGWKSTLAEAVPAGGQATILTPGFDEQYTDVRYAEMTIEGVGEVWRTGDGKVEIAFAATEPYSAAVTNSTGAEWPAGASAYLFCPHLLAEGHNEYDLKGQIWDLQQRVAALEGGTKAASPAKPSTPPSPPPHAAPARPAQTAAPTPHAAVRAPPPKGR